MWEVCPRGLTDYGIIDTSLEVLLPAVEYILFNRLNPKKA